jgi:hypothetical protein
MHLFIGLWRATPAWKALGAAARTMYLSKLSADVRRAVGETAEAIAWGENEDTDSREQWQFFAVWRFPKLELAHTYQKALDAHEWNRYFTTMQVLGTAKTPLDVLTKHVAL